MPGMSTFDVVLFCHIAVVLSAFALAGVLHGSEWLMGRAKTVAELKVVSRPQKLGPLFAVILIALVGLGFTLLHLSKDTDHQLKFSDPFAWTALVVAVLLFLDGPLVLGRHANELAKALETAPDGPVTPELRAMTLSKTFWYTAHLNTFAVVGVVLNMATKPSLVACVVDIVAGAGIGALLAMFGLSRAAASYAAV
jgi:hypothetical protein